MTPNLTTRSADEDPNSGWHDGFTLSSAGMSCDTCAALVRQTSEAAARHREWDEMMLVAAGRKPRPNTITPADVPKR